MRPRDKGAALPPLPPPQSLPLQYLPGFGNEHTSEALPGALPTLGNSPQRCAYGLYAEQLSGSAFTAPRGKNLRTWLYRIRPSVHHDRWVPMDSPRLALPAPGSSGADPNPLRWAPVPMPPSTTRVDWVDGLATVASAGHPSLGRGVAVHVYTANASMVDTAFQNSDGDLLVVPQQGVLHVQTELGFLRVTPGEVVLLPRGMRFRIGLDGPSRGYAAELFSGHFELPGLGPLGSNGLASPHDFLAPVAAYEDRSLDYVVVNKLGGRLFSTVLDSSPFNVVAWRGNYTPYKYDLAKFNTMGTISFDHPDPSIFTVLTAPTDTPGVAAMDFVIFPPRWMVGENTFRPP